MPGSEQAVEIPYQQVRLAGCLHWPSGPARALVVVAHGLQSSMQSEKLTRLARELAAAGYAALRFDHTGCGDSPGDPYAVTLSGRRDELLAAAAFLARQVGEDLPRVYMGSSLGGTAAALAAAVAPPTAVVAWSAPWDLPAVMARLRHDPEVARLTALARDMARHDMSRILPRLRGLLVVHGEQDEVVPVEQARLAHRLAAAPKDLLILPGADHRLSRREQQDRATARTLAWIARSLEGWS
jgi:alpha-beta hydrolase superfamily lysophospholipase